MRHTASGRMANLPMGNRRRLGGFAVLLLLLLVAAAPYSMAKAATYGSDVYGGGPFNVGVDPPPLPVLAPTNTGGGGVVIGGPLGIGYVVTNPTTTIAVATTPPVLGPSATPATTTIPSAAASLSLTPLFVRALRLRDTGTDVQRLQIYLNTHGFRLAGSGPGSPGQETERFGALTYAALIRFQEANAAAILVLLRLTKGTGYFGSSTIAVVNSTL